MTRTARILLATSALALAACSDDDPADAASDTDVDTSDASGDVADASDARDDAATDTDVGPPWQHPLCSRIAGLCTAAPALDGVELDTSVAVVPGAELPAEVVLQQANNNLDVAWFDDRLYLAFRTAPDHFAGPEVEMYVVSSPDLADWRYEGVVSIGTDVREPQLVVAGDTLLLYHAVLGTDRFEFEPQGVRSLTYRGPGDWTEPVPAFDEGFIPWRIHERDGALYLLGYTGGENVYDADGEPIRVHWLTGTDGVQWDPVVPGQPVMLEGGVSETDFVWLDDGGILAVGRNEAGDEGGFGSRICRAPADDLGAWRCQDDPRKFDSPLMFRQGERAYLIGRRTLHNDGEYDLGDDGLSLADRFFRNQVAYWNAPKRCALWQVDADSLTVEHVLDLPSAGDTCFPEAIRLSPWEVMVFNYTSPYDTERDPSWLQGQNGPTRIERVVVRFPE